MTLIQAIGLMKKMHHLFMLKVTTQGKAATQSILQMYQSVLKATMSWGHDNQVKTKLLLSNPPPTVLATVAMLVCLLETRTQALVASVAVLVCLERRRRRQRIALVSTVQMWDETDQANSSSWTLTLKRMMMTLSLSIVQPPGGAWGKEIYYRQPPRTPRQSVTLWRSMTT